MPTPPVAPPPAPGAAAEAGSSHPGPRAEYLFLVLVWIYLSRHLVMHWLYPYLFFKQTARDLVMATGLEQAYMGFSSILAVAGWVLLLSLALDRLHSISRRLLVPLAVLVVVAMAAVEVDMNWFGMARRHVGWQQVLPGLQEVGGGQWGVTRADLRRFVLQVAKQALFIGAMAGVAWWVGRRRWRLPFRVRPGVLALVLVPVLVVDSAAVGHRLASGSKQWNLLVMANPLRPTFADRMWERFFQERQASHLDVEAANQALREARSRSPVPREARPRPPAPLAGKRPDVLLVVAESLNPFLGDPKSMPALFRLARSSFLFRNHYSTANFSEGGQLALLYGAPPTFYRGDQPSDVPGSRYVDLFNREGYRTLAIGHNLRNWRYVETYLANFGEPIRELEHDWDLVPALREEWRRPGPRFVAVFYYGTHFPFDHDERFRAFQPETPVGFDYFSSRLREHQAEVVNRYRNALLELDAWLEAILGLVDLENTVVIVTGDHGEELFENGILGHASDLDAPQIRTPLLVRVPGQAAREFAHVTSHADVLPTVVELLGWDAPAGPGVGSLLEGGSQARAMVADTRYPSPPTRWAVITPGRKSIVERSGEEGRVRITALYDESDRPASFRDDPRAWEENIRRVRALEEAIAASSSHPGGIPAGDHRATR